MTSPSKESKRFLSPAHGTDGSKKSRASYLAESPGGTLRESSPTKVFNTNGHQPPNAALAIASQNFNTQGSTFNECLDKFSVCQKLQLGVAMGLAGVRPIQGLRPHDIPHSRDAYIQRDLERFTTTIGLQHAADRIFNMAQHLDPARIIRDITRSQGPRVMYNTELTIRGPGKGTARNQELVSQQKEASEQRRFGSEYV